MTWERARQWILPALKDGTEAELVDALRSGHAQLWTGPDAAFVTQVSDGDAHAWLAGGRLSGLMALLPGIEAWARGYGCIWATVDGRKGWDRVLKKFGYRRIDGELKKPLQEKGA